MTTNLPLFKNPSQNHYMKMSLFLIDNFDKEKTLKPYGPNTATFYLMCWCNVTLIADIMSKVKTEDLYNKYCNDVPSITLCFEKPTFSKELQRALESYDLGVTPWRDSNGRGYRGIRYIGIKYKIRTLI